MGLAKHLPAALSLDFIRFSAGREEVVDVDLERMGQWSGLFPGRRSL